MNPDSLLTRYRIVFAKTGVLKYTGHLDLLRIWERSLRRAHLPLAYSKGFHPQPRIQQACALPLGFTSRCEILDMWLETCCGSSEIEAVLRSVLPPGVIIRSIEPVSLSEPVLQMRVQSARYLVELLDPPENNILEERINRINSSPALPRERKNKPYDLRPFILELTGTDGAINMLLAAREGATGRPEEVLAELGIAPNASRIERKELLLG